MADLLKFKFIPLQAGYSGEVDSGVIHQVLDGGMPRFRRASKNNANTVNCAWKLDELGYQYCMAFYRKWVRNPARPFHVEMFLDDPFVVNYECWFVPNSVKLTSMNGLIYNISAQLIVKSKRISESFDDEILGIVDKGTDRLFNPMDKLANIDLPNATGVDKGG